MNTSGEAADQVVRMSLEVGEAALKISGTGAKHLAVMLYAVLKEKKKTKGRVRLETLVKSGRPLTVFSVKESDLKQFVQEAKRYGVLYCAVRNPKGSSDGKTGTGRAGKRLSAEIQGGSAYGRVVWRVGEERG